MDADPQLEYFTMIPLEIRTQIFKSMDSKTRAHTSAVCKSFCAEALNVSSDLYNTMPQICYYNFSGNPVNLYRLLERLCTEKIDSNIAANYDFRHISKDFNNQMEKINKLASKVSGLTSMGITVLLKKIIVTAITMRDYHLFARVVYVFSRIGVISESLELDIASYFTYACKFSPKIAGAIVAHGAAADNYANVYTLWGNIIHGGINFCCEKGILDSLQEICSYIDLNVYANENTSDGVSFIYTAALKGHYECVKFICENLRPEKIRPSLMALINIVSPSTYALLVNSATPDYETIIEITKIMNSSTIYYNTKSQYRTYTEIVCEYVKNNFPENWAEFIDLCIPIILSCRGELIGLHLDAIMKQLDTLAQFTKFACDLVKLMSVIVRDCKNDRILNILARISEEMKSRELVFPHNEILAAMKESNIEYEYICVFVACEGELTRANIEMSRVD